MRTRTRIAAALCAAASYTWTGNSDDDWDNPDNWDDGGVEGYPNSVDDNAIVPASEPEWDIDLVNEEILNLTIVASGEFGAATESPLLRVDLVEARRRDGRGQDQRRRDYDVPGIMNDRTAGCGNAHAG